MSSDEGGFGSLILGVFIGAMGLHIYNEYIAEPVIPPPQPQISVAPKRPVSDIPITTFDSKTAWILDVSTVTGDRENRQGWVKADHSNDQNTPYRKTMSLWRANCNTNQYQTLERVTYSPKGDPTRIPSDKEASFAVPDSNAEAVVEALCVPAFD